jgi:hypothetical protein
VNEQFVSYIMAITSYIRWEDNNVRIALDQHTKLDFFISATSLKQQSAGRCVAPLGHIIPIPNQLVFVVSP